LEVTRHDPASGPRFVHSSFGGSQVDYVTAGMAYLDEPLYQWSHPAALTGSRHDVMHPAPGDGLLMRVLVKGPHQSRFTKLWEAGDDWVGDYEGPSVWEAVEPPEEEGMDGLPEGSFLLQTDFMEVHSFLYPDVVGPEARLRLTVVPAHDGKGLDDPDKAWRILYERAMFLIFRPEHWRKAKAVIRWCTEYNG
jgi:hypothetical protein